MKALFSNFVKVDARLVTFTWESIQQLANAIGYNVEDSTIVGNRPEQVSTKKVLELIVRGKYIPTVATIRLRPTDNGFHCCDGGNTFRAIYLALKQSVVESIQAIVMIDNAFSFEGYNQVDSKRTAKQVLGMHFQDGWEVFYSAFFTLACLRSEGLSVNGGGASGRTWKRVAYNDVDSVAELLRTDETLCYTWNFLTDTQTESKRTVLKIAETIAEKSKKFKIDQDGPLLMFAVLDELESWNEDDLRTMIENIDAILEDIIPKWDALWVGVPSVPRQTKYAFLCSVASVAWNELNPSKVSSKHVCNQGFQKLIVADSE